MAAGRRRLRPGGVAVAAALVVVALGSVAAWTVAASDGTRRHQAEAASAAGSLATLERRVQAIEQIEAGSVAGLSALRVQEAPAVLAVGPGLGGSVTVLTGRTGALDVASVVRSARTAMEVARDTGEPQAAPATASLVPLAVALLPPGVVPTSTAQRRVAVSGFRIALVSPAGLLAGLPDASPPPTGLRVNDTPIGRVAGGTTAGTVLVGGQPWTLVLGRVEAPLSRGGVATLGIALLGGLACLLTDLRSQRLLTRERRAAAAIERETRTVADLGPLLQGSLELADVLPAVALLLADQFTLTHFAVKLVGEQGGVVQVFGLGSAPAERHEVELTRGAADELPPGTPASLPLQRAGRTIGRLSFTGQRSLGYAQLAALAAAADLIAVTTYNVELYEREQASVRRLRELDQLKDAFLGTISHELRTPLTAISGFVRLMRDRWDELPDDQRKEFLERVHGNTLSLRLLVDDLLDFARLERQALNAAPTALELDRSVALTLAQLAPIVGSHELVCDLEPVHAVADAGALERVLANLLTNAVKFSPAASRIVVRVRRDHDAAVLEVADEGAGIAAEDLDHVFTRFYRGDSAAARGTRGAGIGLAVVRELVHQMGGTVVAAPNTPRGTRLVIHLQLAAGAGDIPVERRRPDRPATLAPRPVQWSSP